MKNYEKLPFKEQIDFFRKKLNIDTKTWTDIWQEQHAAVFMVAGATKADVLLDIRDAIDKAISQGMTIRDFRKNFDKIVDKYGWNYNGGRNWRTRVIYDTNLSQSYHAGRWQQHQNNKVARPYLRYQHNSEQNYREEHKSWNNLILPIDDRFWKTHYPQNGWGCKCAVYSENDESLKRKGLNIGKRPPVILQEHIVGKTTNPHLITSPEGIDPGFAYNVGDAYLSGVAQNVYAKFDGYPNSLASSVKDQLAKYLEPATAVGFSKFVDEALNNNTQNKIYSVGALSTEQLALLAEYGISPLAIRITITDKQIKHLIRTTKKKPISLDDLVNLPSVLASPEAIYIDKISKKGETVLLFTFPSATKKGKFVVQVNCVEDFRIPGEKKQRFYVNSIRSAGIVLESNLSGSQYIKIL